MRGGGNDTAACRAKRRELRYKPRRRDGPRGGRGRRHSEGDHRDGDGDGQASLHLRSVVGAARKRKGSAAYAGLIPTTMESGPANGSTRVFSKPMSVIHD